MFSFFKKNDADEKGKGLKLWLILGGALLGVALLLFGGNLQAGSEKMQPTATTTVQESLISYQAYLEERVTALCESVDGVGKVTVMITLAGDFETVYATELSDKGEEYVILGNGSSASALPLTCTTPEIAGIGIVCQGGDNASVRGELISLISATFHIPTNRIHVARAKK